MSPEAMREAVAKSVGFDQWVIVKRNLYYRPNAAGYTSSLDDAWKLPRAEALKYEYCVDREDVPFEGKVFIKPVPTPDYPGDIKAAWGLLGELKKDGWRIGLRSPYVNGVVSVSRGDWNTESWHACFNDLSPEKSALAICTVYLKAKGLWKEGEK